MKASRGFCNGNVYITLAHSSTAHALPINLIIIIIIIIITIIIIIIIINQLY